jgi:hypothetical protein
MTADFAEQIATLFVVVLSLGDFVTNVETVDIGAFTILANLGKLKT